MLSIAIYFVIHLGSPCQITIISAKKKMLYIVQLAHLQESFRGAADKLNCKIWLYEKVETTGLHELIVPQAREADEKIPNEEFLMSIVSHYKMFRIS